MKQSLHRYLAPIAGGALLAVLLSPLPALAHHGWGGNEDKEFELSGTVTTSALTRSRTLQRPPFTVFMVFLLQTR